MLQARTKLPSHATAVWRGVKDLNLSKDYEKGQELYWWAFNSTTKDLETLKTPMFCGTSGQRTQFMIEASSGVDIECFSMVDSEEEVLLFPGTKLKVVSAAYQGSGLYQVHLREVKLPVQSIK